MDVELKFGNKTVNPDIRMLGDMTEVIYDRKWLDNAGDIRLYYMYRDLALNEEDRGILRGENLRYDITIIPPNNLGSEFVKTAGHYHPKVPGTDLSYTEIYEVLEGRAHYLLQKLEENRITDAVLVRAEAGDMVIIPPNYGHITINPSEEALRMANFVSDRFSSIYDPIKEKCGGVYFELVNGEFIWNENYENRPELRFIKAKNLRGFDITKSRDMYSLIKKPGKLRFLNAPQKFMTLLNRVLD